MASKTTGSVTPGVSNAEEPKNKPSLSLHTATDAPTPELDSPASTLIFMSSLGGGFQVEFGCAADRTGDLRSDVRVNTLMVSSSAIKCFHECMCPKWTLINVFVNCLAPGSPNRLQSDRCLHELCMKLPVFGTRLSSISHHFHNLLICEFPYTSCHRALHQRMFPRISATKKLEVIHDAHVFVLPDILHVGFSGAWVRCCRGCVHAY